ncbi:hypothetical protein MWT96_24890 (plasmid) [Prescottella equi]|uniref:Uncharacterized protein n=1 Tax=Rhodococcus hoagii TaxID=43767 RepID=A0A9Q4ZSQ3_RHOHA|nr:hypothetical protein [Prescottella equi]AVR64892.1 hypothetical protein pRERM130c [Prescottella equi]MBM4479807.1 hypothetical protein [Prescottella equi]MBM4487685.1 hypothetical protein [Prescottella equi]MBM4495164.1 hypothetical protein [Prescottella equi]MBM4498369.1 hypothetical protein [Prescottella equi]
MRAFIVDVLAQDGQGGANINITPTPPPQADKFQMLLGVGLWVATAALVGLGVLAGVKFAQAYADGHGGRGEKFMIVAVAVGAVISASAASYVSWFMG